MQGWRIPILVYKTTGAFVGFCMLDTIFYMKVHPQSGDQLLKLLRCSWSKEFF